MPQHIFEELAQLEQVEALALGGSRAGQDFDKDSDYDVYVYLSAPLSPDIRKEILSKYCSYMEIGNQFWELEDDCVLNNGIEIELIYRSLDEFDKDLQAVVLEHQAQNSYTTCMWYNLLNSKIIYDQDGHYATLHKKYNLPYPAELKKNIINKQFLLLNQAMPAFSRQIKKALKRKDLLSINHAVVSFSLLISIYSLPSMSSSTQEKNACSSTQKIIALIYLNILKTISKTIFKISTC